MNDPAFNLLQLERRPNWYDYLPQVEAAMTECARVERLRYAAGWTADEGGWISPNGVPASDWEDDELPFPEDPGYADWASAYWHYEAVDAGQLPVLEQQLADARAAQAA